MYVKADLAAASLSLEDADDFTAFHVAASGDGTDVDVGELLSAKGAGAGAEASNHVWVSQQWLRDTATAAGAGSEWADGFDKMLGFAAKMGWIDDSGSLVRAHTEWAHPER